MTAANDPLAELLEESLAPAAPELHAWLENAPQPGEGVAPDEPPPWAIDGERTAEWAARKVLAARAERTAAKALADEMRARAKEYEERVIHRTERTLSYFEGRLRAWHDTILADSPRRKTIELPSAKLARRIGGLSMEITDADALTRWLEDNDPECLDYPNPTVKKDDVKDRYGAKATEDPDDYPLFSEVTGEVIPGAKLVRGVPSETIKAVTLGDPE